MIKSNQWETKDSDTDLGFKKGTYYLRMTMIFYKISPIYLLYIKYFLFISTFDKLLKLRGILNFGSKQIKMALKSFQVCSVKLDFTFIYPRYH